MSWVYRIMDSWTRNLRVNFTYVWNKTSLTLIALFLQTLCVSSLTVLSGSQELWTSGRENWFHSDPKSLLVCNQELDYFEEMWTSSIVTLLFSLSLLILLHLWQAPVLLVENWVCHQNYFGGKGAKKHLIMLPMHCKHVVPLYDSYFQLSVYILRFRIAILDNQNTTTQKIKFA